MTSTISESSILLQIILLMFIIFGYSVYAFIHRKTLLNERKEEVNNFALNFDDTLNTILVKKANERSKKNTIKNKTLTDQDDDQMSYSIILESDIKLLETDTCLLIKGSVQSIEKICYEFSNMEHLPESFCVQLGDWKLFILEQKPQSSREHKTIIMPANYWFVMSNKLKEIMYEEENNPYHNNCEPGTFKKVLEYGIGVEAIHHPGFKKRKLSYHSA